MSAMICWVILKRYELGMKTPVSNTFKSKPMSKYQWLAEQLREKIQSGEFAPGSTIPSQQQLIDQYGVSLSTVRNAVSCLSVEGYVAAKHGMGVVVLEPKTEARRVTGQVLGFVVVTSEGEPRVSDFAALNGAAEYARSLGWSVTYATIAPTSQGIADLERYVAGLDGVMLKSESHPLVLDCLRRQNTPLVLLDHPDVMGIQTGEFSTVDFDRQSIGYLAGQTLAMHGHRNLALVYFVEEWAIAPVIEGLREACEDYQIPSARHIESHNNEQNILMTKELARDDQTTGIIVLGWGHSNTMIGRLIDQGVNVPQDKSVLAVGYPHAGELYQDFNETGIVCSAERQGREAARILIESPSRKVDKVLLGRFKQGATVANQTC
ncbi:MAG: hypothetical protein CMJ19_23895 [Phycisphaeraceae bacterium]|nr:hypothetical protein [Phycisphaeraceae bacterium]